MWAFLVLFLRVNGAINIADRYQSGESHHQSDRTCRQNAGADDSATDKVSLAGPQGTSPMLQPSKLLVERMHLENQQAGSLGLKFCGESLASSDAGGGQSERRGCDASHKV